MGLILGLMVIDMMGSGFSAKKRGRVQISFQMETDTLGITKMVILVDMEYTHGKMEVFTKDSF